MKKSAVFTIIACSIATVIMVCVLAVGLTNEGFGIIARIKGISEGTMDHEYTYQWDPAETKVDALDIRWVNGPIELKVSSSNVIRITERTHRELEEREKLTLTSSGGKLKIKWNGELVSIGTLINYSKSLTVEVPKELAEGLEELSCSNESGDIVAGSFTADEVNISSASGGLELSSLLAKELRLTTNSGNIKATGIKAEEDMEISTTSGLVSLDEALADAMDISTTSGKVELAGKAQKINISSVSAAVDARLSQCPQEADMEAVSGKLSLAIPDNDGFRAEYSTVSGTFSTDFRVAESFRDGLAEYGSGKARLNFSTTSGGIEIIKN